MGILKHVVLPILAVLEAGFVGIFLTGNKLKLPQILELPGAEDERTLMELHFMTAACCGGMGALLFGCLAGILYEDSHFRAMVVVMHLIFFAVDAYDYWTLDGYDPTGATAMFLLCLVGLIIHSQEPGLLTADKSKKDVKNQ